MGWWVYLVDPETEEPVQVPGFQEGGIVRCLPLDEYAREKWGLETAAATRLRQVLVPVDCCDAEVSVTYNYHVHFRDALGYEFGELNGKIAADVIPDLQAAVEKLGTDRDESYWKATKGNAGVILELLLTWAELHPSGKFVVH